jgi:phosphoadenosine phosphosulfate reductase
LNVCVRPHDALLADAPIDTDDPTADAKAVMRWAHARFGTDLCLTASLGDATLVHVAQSVVPGIEVTLLDTGYLFAETEWYADHLRGRFDLRLRVVRPAADLEGDLWRSDAARCCAERKVEPLGRALAGRSAWVTGVRRDDTDSRRTTALVHLDPARKIIKVNPLAGWSEEHVERYRLDHDLPEHPLADRDYTSIGCWPCTRPATDPDDPRSGRWSGTDKTECGLHAVAVEVTR